VMRLKSLERILQILAGPREADVAYRDLHGSLRSLGPEEIMRQVLLKADSLVCAPDGAIAVQLGNDDPDHEQDADSGHDGKFGSDTDVGQTNHGLAPQLVLYSMG